LAQLPLPFPLAPAARLETFVPGDNGAALSRLAALASTEAPGAQTLWIWGAPGCGKSHLLQAACASAAGQRVIYLPLADLEEPSPALLQGLETLALVALDDVDAVAGISSWDQALFSLFNGLQSEQGRLILAAGRSPAATAFSLPDLASRAAGSLVYRLTPLDDEDSVVALQSHARFRGLELPESAARYLLHRVERDMGGLCRWLDTLDRAALAAKRKLTIPFIREILAARP